MSASKRDQLVQKALKAFYAGGFHAVGMDRLAKETGVSKTAIYKHFRTKDELILATLRLRDEQFRNWLMRRVEELADTPQAQLLAVFTAHGEWFQESHYKSCMFIKASSEYQDRRSPIHVTAAEHKRLLRDYIEKLATAAKLKDPTLVAGQIMLLIEGAIVLAHLHEPEVAASEAHAAATILINAAA